MRWTELKACLSTLYINFIVFISELSLIKWRSTSYFSWNSIQTSVNILYKKCCKVVTCREFFYNFFCKCFSLCTLPSRDLFPIFANVQCHIIKKYWSQPFGQYGKISNLGLAVLPRHRYVNTAKTRWIFSRTTLTRRQYVTIPASNESCICTWRQERGNPNITINMQAMQHSKHTITRIVFSLIIKMQQNKCNKSLYWINTGIGSNAKYWFYAK
jgi:hypothetical protein